MRIKTLRAGGDRSAPGRSQPASPMAIVLTKPKAQQGFTLFELLVVMLIIALSLGAVSFLYRSPSRERDLKTSALLTASRLRDLRAAAMSSRSERVATINIATRTIHFGDDRAGIELNRAIAMTVTGADSEISSQSSAGVRFYPNGSSSGATIAFRSNGQAYEIRVNWLTGRVSTSALR